MLPFIKVPDRKEQKALQYPTSATQRSCGWTGTPTGSAAGASADTCTGTHVHTPHGGVSNVPALLNSHHLHWKDPLADTKGRVIAWKRILTNIH